MFDTVLVANRGEIAVRVLRTLRRLGVRGVAVHSDADAGARHVLEADAAVRLGPAPAAASYLSVERVVAAALASGAQAVHPGYGFLSENAAFAAACADAGLVFVGPPAHAVEVMGDKIRAKATVAAAGVPVVPGLAEPGLDDDALVAAAQAVGYPVLVKPSAGGGGKGMRLVHEPGALRDALASARREALSAFGDDTLFLERFVLSPRHVEVQVLADAHGGVVHLGERECSLQRRHQKVVEEAPSPLLDAATRARIGGAAVETARSVGYEGAGTVEFIVSADRPDEFFFLEMNTRLQVEHPVTELVTGLDLVELQLRVAAGEPLPLRQEDVRLDGHAVEARVYAEDPARGFLPTGGRVLLLREPAGEGVRVDSGLVAGAEVGTTYDPMLAKVVAHGADRAAALARLDRALAGTAVLGVGTNVPFLRALLAHPDVRAGRLDTGLVERDLDALVARDVPEDALAAYGLARLHELEPQGPADPWDVPSGWRPGGPAWTTWRVAAPGADPVPVAVRGRAQAADVRVGDGPARAASVRAAGDGLLVTLDGTASRWLVARDGATLWLGREGAAWALAEAPRAPRGAAAAAGGGELRSPMPGTVVAVLVEDGARVAQDQAVVVVEAMKMEHALRAPVAGTVALAGVPVGGAVALDELLATVEP
ncbi:acetyl/propionyl/methylcrotonyl-CoA carboxylase subunit alpha [Vallicoccus soli]|uniref:biotin carboxylase n=1 Tax=Vallicoccus soli TaxID=2339232 RepID=A0A3A3ZKT0_9ACTN|nr:biotin carboxylase N-terminal domain-containing protein [Vallicoccus soli]RJK96554.1 ATP-grasp domain-containing protein [Vallicoccus soli]